MKVGDAVHGEVISADASAGVAVLLYDSATVIARALAADECLTITDIAFSSTAGGVYDLVWGTVAVGRHIVKGNAGVLGQVIVSLDTPITGPKGSVPTLIAAAGQVDLTVSGYLTKG